jgi:hypothetical protein
MAKPHERVIVKIAGRAIDILREKFPDQVPPKSRKTSYNVNRYVMDLILDDHERGLTPLSDLQ